MSEFFTKQNIIVCFITILLLVIFIFHSPQEFNPEKDVCTQDCHDYFMNVCKGDIRSSCTESQYYLNHCVVDGNYVPEQDRYKCIKWRPLNICDTEPNNAECICDVKNESICKYPLSNIIPHT